MKRTTVSRITALSAGTLMAATLMPAAAFGLGAGDGYRIGNAGEEPTSNCSVNSVFTGEDGKKYMLSAGHCTDVGISEGRLQEGQVRAYDLDGNEIGAVVAEETHIVGINVEEGDENYDPNRPNRDWVLIELNDDVELDEGVSSRPLEALLGDTLPASENSPLEYASHAVAGEHVYRDGNTTGRTSGVVLANSEKETMVLTWAIPGDSGGVLHDGNGGNLGITSRSAVYLPLSMYGHTDDAIERAEAASGVSTGVEIKDANERDHNFWGGPIGETLYQMEQSEQDNPELQTVKSNAVNTAVDTVFAVDDTLVQINDHTGGSVDAAYYGSAEAVNNATVAAEQTHQDYQQVADVVTTAQTDPVAGYAQAEELVNQGVADIQSHVDSTVQGAVNDFTGGYQW